MAWKKLNITTDNGEVVEATAPEIISASRSTDIPAFYMDWFIDRLNKGYSVWTNPFNNQKQYISYNNCRFIVFWSKNPASLLNCKDILSEKNIKCYIQYTLNDYVDEDLEPNVPSVASRIETFKQLVNLYGKNSVIWRFDPLILTDTIDVDKLIEKIKNIGQQLVGYTNKLVFSFCDIKTYLKVQNNLKKYNVSYREWDSESMNDFAQKLSVMNKEFGWYYTLATCAEKIDLKQYGIEHNHCIDDKLITKIAYEDDNLMKFLGIEICSVSRDLLTDEAVIPDNAIMLSKQLYAVRTKSNRDSGQRALCGCMKSKDIGEYNTCIHQCKYCYANTDNNSAMDNYKKHLENKNSETITGR